MKTELYDLLGVSPKSTEEQIRKHFRTLTRVHHPDAGGDEEYFKKLTSAYETLTDPVKRARYDTTGRVDESPVTPEKIRAMLASLVKSAVEAEVLGMTDSPILEDIRNKMILSLRGGRKEVQNGTAKAKHRLQRATRMLERFKKLKDSEIEGDPVGDVLKAEVERFNTEIQMLSDALELSEAVERVLNQYLYEVGPGPEGQYSPGPTNRQQRLIPGDDLRFTRVYRDG